MGTFKGLARSILMLFLTAATVEVNGQAQVRISAKGQIEPLTTGSSVFLGENAGELDAVPTGKNVFVGFASGYSNTEGVNHTAVGYESLFNTSGGANCCAIGYNALRQNTTSLHNIAVGSFALANANANSYNTAVGGLALRYNTTGEFNVACGASALGLGTGGSFNVAVGGSALFENTASNNTAVGNLAMNENETGAENVAVGASALLNNAAGHGNVAMGFSSSFSNTTGDFNAIIGHRAGYGDYLESNRNAYFGAYAGGASTNNTYTRTNNVMLGYESGFASSGSNNVFIGYQAGKQSTLSNRLFIDNSSTSSPLILGDFGADELQVNGRLKVDNPGSAEAIVWDGDLTRLKDGNDLLSTNRAVLRILIDADNNNTGGTGQSRVQFFTNTDTSGAITPPVNFNLDGGDSWIDSGNLGIGVDDPAYTLDVAGVVNASSGGSGGQTAFRAQGAEAIWFNGTQFSWGFGGTWNRFADSVRIGTNVSPSHLLQVDGVARSTQSTWATTSDIRVKKDVETIESGLHTIMQFRPVTFGWTDAYKMAHPESRDINYGFISQEVEEIIPSMVTRVKEVIGDTTIEDFRVLNTDPLVPLLVKAVQEQQAQIEALTQKLLRYEEVLNRLDAAVSASSGSVDPIPAGPQEP